MTVKAVIEDICMKYGANCLVVKGQSSFTRITDICRKAKKTNRPILVLGIYDLDCAGWDMIKAFMKRVRQKYPREHHKFERVALLREQAEKFNLPTSFEPDDKGYPEAQKERFYRESGGTTCIELDAMDNKEIRKVLETELKDYSGLKLDKIQERRFRKRENRTIKRIIDEYDPSEHEVKYKRFYERYNEFYDNIEKIKKYLRAKYDFISDQLYKIEDKIKSDLSQKLENGGEA